MFWEGDLQMKMVMGRRNFAAENDRTVIDYNEVWERGGLRDKFKKRPFPFWRVWIAKYREKRRWEKVERARWAEKMRMKAERKKAREAKALEAKSNPLTP